MFRRARDIYSFLLKSTHSNSVTIRHYLMSSMLTPSHRQRMDSSRTKNCSAFVHSFSSRSLRSPLWCRITTVASCCLNRRIPRRSTPRLDMGRGWWDDGNWEQAQDGGDQKKVKWLQLSPRYSGISSSSFSFAIEMKQTLSPFSTRRLRENCWSNSFSSKQLTPDAAVLFGDWSSF